MSERSVPPGVLYRPVAGRPVDSDEGGQDADQEQDQHHVLGKPDVLLLDPRRSSASEEVFLSVKLPAAETSPSPGLFQ